MTLVSETPTLKAAGTHKLPVDHLIVTLDQIAGLNDAVVSADADVAKGYALKATVQSKRKALEDRLAAIPSGLMEGFGDIEASLADALAADPGSTLAEDDFAAATARRVEARRAGEARAAERSVTERAIAKVDEELASIIAEIESLQEQRVTRWRAFLEAAHPFLIDRFRTAFLQLVEGTLQVAVDLQNVEINQRQLVPYTAWKVVRDSSIKLARNVLHERWQEGGTEPWTTSYDTEVVKLFDYEFTSPIGGSSEAIDRFRAELSSDAPAEAGRRANRASK